MQADVVCRWQLVFWPKGRRLIAPHWYPLQETKTHCHNRRGRSVFRASRPILLLRILISKGCNKGKIVKRKFGRQS